MTSYNLQNLYLAKVKERTLLSKKGALKQTYKVVLDIKNSDLTFKPGDSLAVMPKNHPFVVERCLEAMHAKKGGFFQNLPLEEFLTTKVNLNRFTKKLLKYLLDNADSTAKKEKLSSLLLEENKEDLKAYSESHEVWDMLMELSSKNISYENICPLLLPLFPRLYSISSCLDVYKDELHLTVALVTYETSHLERFGVASYYLCKGQDDKIPVYVHPAHNFSLPPDKNTPIIMVGPGVGLAPFISFMQKRSHDNASNKNWLFFGEKNKNTDFYYQDFLEKLQKENFLKLTLAFSRDQEEKIYVQHKMLENAKEFWKWLEEGACFYVCGNAKKMAKEVDLSLRAIVQTQGGLNLNDASHFINMLYTQKRYLRDVY
jgi:sulfite reductase (NADPH) flavoprotein alpha-component